MNRLWVRLSAVIGAAVVVAAGVVLIAAILVHREAARDKVRLRSGLVEALASYHELNGGWRGVASVLAAAQKWERPWERPLLVVLDADGNVMYRTHRPARGVMRLAEPEPPMPIEEAGRVVGYVQVIPVDRGRRPVANPLIRELLLMAAVGSVIGVVAGVAVSRSLTAPLGKLAVAARAVAGGARGPPVEEAGSDEMREVARAFNEMVEALERSERRRQDLVADVAHELRTPLTVLQGNLQAMLDGVYPLESDELARLHRQTRLLARLVDDLDEVARAEAGQLALDTAATDIRPLLIETVEAVAPGAKAQGLTLEVMAPEDLPLVRIDSARISQVLHNLLANAARHTAAGGTIKVVAGRERDFVVIEVSDTGEGIPAEALPHVFERFYRADPARSRETGGAGLGLAIVRALVEAHGGT
ncbi:MAG: sensor histidine kinase, partial [Anaerolineae bacterium]